MRIEDFDFKVGDIVQIKRDPKNAGKVGKIINIYPSLDHSGEPMLMYIIKLSDRESTAASGLNLNFVRREDDEQ